MSALNRAAFDGSDERILALLSRRSIPIDQRATSCVGRTPLMIGAQQGYCRVVRALLNRGAKVSLVDNEGGTALHVSAPLGHLAVTLLLVKAGADLEARTPKGHYTPLHLAATHGRSEVSTMLVEAGADLEASTNEGYTPLHLAAMDGR